jgi:cardiolipin synthase A/B
MLCVALAGCASERHVVFDAGAAPPDELQAQQEVQREIDRAPPVTGNRVDLLRDGTEALPAMFAALRHARDSINLEFYTFDDVRSGGQTLGDVLIDRLRHGVAVAIIYDGFGSNATPASFTRRLAEAGASITVFNGNPAAPDGIDGLNDRDHRKVMVIDGRIGFLGGVNFDHVYENPPAMGVAGNDPRHAYWRDTEVRVTGPVVADLQRDFFDTWRKQNGAPLAPRSGFLSFEWPTTRPCACSPANRATLIRCITYGCCALCTPRGEASASAPGISFRRTRSAKN